MADIASHLPDNSPIVEAIYAHYKSTGDAETPRGYLGASIIGHSCERYLWYTFRHCCRPAFSGRMYRLFSTGDHEEARFVSDLRAIGCEVHDTVDNDGLTQFEVNDVGGHVSGHMDGCAIRIPGADKTWHVLEFKTHCAKSFAKLKKDGVKKTKPMHYAQMQTYMHLTGMKRALYLAVNKDTDELYAERVEYNKEEAIALIERSKRIIFSTEPPERISTRKDWYECSYCDAKEICWGSDQSALPIPEVNCRQCCHSTPTMDGNASWVCEKHKRGLSPADQSKACEDHLILTGLITFATLDTFGEYEGRGWAEFQNNESIEKWQHGAGGFSTLELMQLPPRALASPILDYAKDSMGAVVTRCSTGKILERYPESCSRILWQGRQEDLVDNWCKLFNTSILEEEPIEREDGLNFNAAEFECGRVAIVYTDTRQATILQGIE
jgi:hypothetical protein